MKNIHILPTDKASNLLFEKISNRYYTNSRRKENTKNVQNQNIYITSDEEIKEGDWFLEKAGRQYPIQWNGIEKLNFHCKKIILTTDPKLIADGVQAIDDEFLEWFVKNPSCEWVEVKPLMAGFVDDEPSYYENMYEIIIPSEEPKEQTIEEIVETLDTKQLDELDIFLKGAQWKEEQDKKKYTEEEVEQIAKDAYEMGRKNLLIGVFNKWFNGIKKK